MDRERSRLLLTYQLPLHTHTRTQHPAAVVRLAAAQVMYVRVIKPIGPLLPPCPPPPQTHNTINNPQTAVTPTTLPGFAITTVAAEYVATALYALRLATIYRSLLRARNQHEYVDGYM